ncbi:MAG: GNAT family N-acetyltransferase [Dehalococcoidales bacterium]|nr:GNAT family N-acetyltransferase [Dehalococcoidales bacterium]
MTTRDELEIKEVTGRKGIVESGKLIRLAFATVAREFGLTRRNCAAHPAFISLKSLEEGQEKGIKYFGGYLDGEEVGFVAIEKSPEKGLYYMEKLAVHPYLRHRGYGKQLVAFAIDYVQKQGGKKISIGIIDDHTVLKKWYKTLGFRETGTNRFPHLPFTVGYMEMNIK